MLIQDKPKNRLHQDISYLTSVTEAAKNAELNFEVKPVLGMDLLVQGQNKILAFRFDSSKWAFKPYQLGQFLQGVEALKKKNPGNLLQTILVTSLTPPSYLEEVFKMSKITIIHNVSVLTTKEELKKRVSDLAATCSGVR